MKKYGTGKPPRAKHRRPRKPPPMLATLPPIESMVRCTCLQTQAYLGVSLPTVYGLIRSGELQSYLEDGHRWIKPESIARFKLPPDQRPPVRQDKFERVRLPPRSPGRPAKRVAMEAA
jgi:hypothetical protein